MFTLKTQGVFKRFQCEHILSLLSVFCRNLECTGGTAARSSRGGALVGEGMLCAGWLGGAV